MFLVPVAQLTEMFELAQSVDYQRAQAILLVFVVLGLFMLAVGFVWLGRAILSKTDTGKLTAQAGETREDTLKVAVDALTRQVEAGGQLAREVTTVVSDNTTAFREMTAAFKSMQLASHDDTQALIKTLNTTGDKRTAEAVDKINSALAAGFKQQQSTLDDIRRILESTLKEARDQHSTLAAQVARALVMLEEVKQSSQFAEKASPVTVVNQPVVNTEGAATP